MLQNNPTKYLKNSAIKNINKKFATKNINKKSTTKSVNKLSSILISIFINPECVWLGISVREIYQVVLPAQPVFGLG